ncbi:hypothetical protein [Cytobacillus sp. IB215665]|uniref:hypothetical protein n=1 Tax=Cytobacillus sp. IB215665 TaxID=3097357 RepID=UPI002A120A07|nr:hypothetical protein [Cytobacillus sp. IB215665]MDX8364714.1 hypothetical protein [Cytobacillus sp. IB215665]
MFKKVIFFTMTLCIVATLALTINTQNASAANGELKEDSLIINIDKPKVKIVPLKADEILPAG